jgi:PAS domain S-box-containing protein
MARRMAEFDWEATSLGPPDSWPQTLRTAVRILLASRHAMWIGWGPDLAFLYNDAYKATLGVKHPAALGWSIQQVWSEIWHDIGPRIQMVMQTGAATWDEDLFLVLERRGYLEETYHTFSYSPLTEDDGSVSGMLCVVTEETERVIGERRLASLHELSSALATTTTELDSLAAIERVLARSSKDLPFTLTYFFKNAGTHARLVARTGIPLGHPAAPRLINIGTKDPVWPGEALLQENAPILVNNLAARFDDLPTGVWEKPARQALLVPIAQQGQTQPAGFLVAGLNPFRRLDESYSGFIQLIAAQVAAIQNITLRIEAEEAQRRLQHDRDEVLARLKLQFERMPIACAVFDPQWRVIEWNPAAETTFGYRRDEVMGRHGPLLLVSPPLRTQLQNILDRLVAGDMSAHSVNENVTKDGRTIICEWRNTPLLDAAGQVIGVLSMAQDITERVRAQEALSQVNRRLELALQGSDIGIWELELPDGTFETSRVVYSNAREQLGYGRTESTPDLADGISLIHPEDRERLTNAYRSYLAGETELLECEHRLRHKDGSYRTMLVRGVGVGDVSGKPIRVIGSRVDITDRKRTEEAGRDSEERFRRLFELGTPGRAITSPTKRCLVVNDGFCSIVGYDRAELLQKSWPELTHPDDLAADIQQFNRVMAGEIDGYSMDKRFIRKDGTVVDTTLWVDCVRRTDGAVDYFVALVQDVTERKRADEALRKSEERYRSLISQVKDFAIFSTDERGIVTTWNEGCQVVLGYSQEEFIGLDTAQLFTAEDRAQGILAADLRQAREVGTAGTERWMIARGGRRFFAIGATAAFRDSARRVIGFSWVVRDVTPMKEFQDQLTQRGESLERLVSERTGELEETTLRLRVSERMAALGTLAAGLGHDMGNLLLPMDVRLGLLIEADLPRELHEHVVGIQKCARYLQHLSSGLRLLATDPAHVESRGATDLGRWWNDVRLILKDVLPGAIRFEHHLPESESWVSMGRTGLTQAVFNLVQNAADAIKEHGGSRVSLNVESAPSDPWIAIRVADDGPGMTEEVARRCMEPYFSTKSRGESTGMGLSLVHALVTGAGGQIEVQSAPGQGATVSLILPRALPKERTQDTSPDTAGIV